MRKLLTALIAAMLGWGWAGVAAAQVDVHVRHRG